jgi:hypothetical protein
MPVCRYHLRATFHGKLCAASDLDSLISGASRQTLLFSAKIVHISFENESQFVQIGDFGFHYNHSAFPDQLNSLRSHISPKSKLETITFDSEARLSRIEELYF